MKATLKQCIECKPGVLRPLWKSNPPLCKVHAHYRTAKKQIADKKENGVSDRLALWYQKIYDMAGGICAETGRKLKFDKKCCAHLLNKARYPYFKFDLRNGILLDWHIHSILDQGSPAQRKALNTWEYISLQRKRLLEEVGMTYEEDFWLNMKT